MLPFTKIISCTLLYLLLSGCAGQVPTRSGFLDNYGPLQPFGRRDCAAVAPAQPISYQTVTIAPIRFADSVATRLSHTEQETLAGILTQALRQELTPTSRPTGTNATLRIRAAITAINESRPALNLLTTLALFLPLDTGGVSVELEALDQVTGQRIAAMSAGQSGSPLWFWSSFQRLGHAEKGLPLLAAEFHHLLTAAAPGIAPADHHPLP